MAEYGRIEVRAVVCHDNDWSLLGHVFIAVSASPEQTSENGKNQQIAHNLVGEAWPWRCDQRQLWFLNGG